MYIKYMYLPYLYLILFAFLLSRSVAKYKCIFMYMALCHVHGSYKCKNTLAKLVVPVVTVQVWVERGRGDSSGDKDEGICYDKLGWSPHCRVNGLARSIQRTVPLPLPRRTRTIVLISPTPRQFTVNCPFSG